MAFTALKILLSVSFVLLASASMGCSADNSSDAVKPKSFYEAALECEKTRNNECIVVNYYQAFSFKQVPHDVYFSKMEIFLHAVGLFVLNSEDKNTPIDLWNKYKYLNLALFSSKTLYPTGSAVEATLFILLMKNLSASHICSNWEEHEKRIHYVRSNYSNWREFNDSDLDDIEKHDLQFVHQELVAIFNDNKICDENSVDKNVLLKLFKD